MQILKKACYNLPGVSALVLPIAQTALLVVWSTCETPAATEYAADQTAMICSSKILALPKHKNHVELIRTLHLHSSRIHLRYSDFTNHAFDSSSSKNDVTCRTVSSWASRWPRTHKPMKVLSTTGMFTVARQSTGQLSSLGSTS